MGKTKKIALTAVGIIALGATGYAALEGHSDGCQYDDPEICTLVETLERVKALETRVAALQPPPGPAGPQGDPGNPGPIGIPGKDGISVSREELLQSFQLSARMSREIETARYLGEGLEKRLRDLELGAGLIEGEVATLEAKQACAEVAIANNLDPETECGL